MSKELIRQINTLDGTEKYDKEIALIDIFMYVINNKENLPESALLNIFIEISEWRDISLADGSEAYYDENSPEMKKHIIEALKINDNTELLNIYESGFEGAEQNYEIIDGWIINNQWQLNDWLDNVIRKYAEDCL